MAETGQVASAVNTTPTIGVSQNLTSEFSTTSHTEQQDIKLDCCSSPIQMTNPESNDDEKPKIEPKDDEQSTAAGTTVQQDRQPAISPEPNCSICLGKMENKSFTNSCFHQFCFTCLLEWSKVKPECPLCKQSFKSIVHNVRSMEDYDQYHLRFEDFNSWENPDGRRFRYRSTLTSERRRELNLGRFLTSQRLGSTSLRRSTRSSTVLATGTHRRLVYEMDLWVRQPSSTRFRESSPQFYTLNPACTHRLVPWINRELIALQYGHQSAFLMELILSLILRFHIRSPEFEELIRPYFLRNTKHFIHEFHSFARSPYDMVEYDRHTSYVGHSENPLLSDGSDSDVIVLSPDHSSRPRWSQRPVSFPRQSSDAGGNPPSVINRARDFLDSLRMLDGTLSNLREASSLNPLPLSPQPGPSGLQSNTIFLNETDSSDEDSYGQTTSNMKTEVVIPDDEEDDDDCIVVAYEKPLQEQSPIDVIVLSDSSDDELSLRNAASSEQVLDLSQHASSSMADLNFQNADHSSQQGSSTLSSQLASSSSSSSHQSRHSSTNSSSSHLEHRHSSASSSSHGSKRRHTSTSTSPTRLLQNQSEDASTSKTTKHKRHRSSSHKSGSRHKHRSKHRHHRSKQGSSRSHSRQNDTSDEDYVPYSSHHKSSKKKHKHKHKQSRLLDKKPSVEKNEEKQAENRETLSTINDDQALPSSTP